MAVDNFLKNAKGLAKNPLGIIALFISLIYGFACIVLGISRNDFQGNENIPLIWFLVFFPVLVLIAFVYLVACHHKKLYAPSDFRDDKSFLEAADSIVKENKIIDEFKDFTLETESSTVKKQTKATTEQTNKDYNKTIQFNNFRNRLLLIENKAIKYLERMYNQSIYKDVRIKGIGRIPFDGVIETDKEISIVEIKYIKTLSKNRMRIDHLKKVYEEVVKFSKSKQTEKRVKFLVLYIVEGVEMFLSDDLSTMSDFENAGVEIITHTITVEELNQE